ncbi:MAG: aminotransferase, partial [Pseudomonadota bacterium]
MTEIPAPGAAMKALYDLDPAVTFLNHGSYGAVAKPLKDIQRHWAGVIDRNPDQFIRDEWPEIWDQTRAKLGAFVGAKPEQLGLVANATAGLQSAAMAVPIKPGQRILIHSHIYNALH